VKLAAAFLALLVGVFVWLHWRTSRVEAQLRPVASAVAGRQIAVDCQGWLASLVDVQSREGDVHLDASGRAEPRIFLTNSACSRLHGFAGHHHHTPLDCLESVDWSRPNPLQPGDDCARKAAPTIFALLVLAHEAYHTAGVTAEATTNCYAIQALAFTATSLGTSQQEGELAANAMAELEPYQSDE
jgi:hypothetical protein